MLGQDPQFSGKDEVFRYEMLKERCGNFKTNKQKQKKTKQNKKNNNYKNNQKPEKQNTALYHRLLNCSGNINRSITAYQATHTV